MLVEVLLALSWLSPCAGVSTTQAGSTTQANETAARERSRKATQLQFAESFRSIQIVSKGLLKAHEDGTLVPGQLSKDARAIQRYARSLRSLMALGPPTTKPREPEHQLHTSRDFDVAIRNLTTLVWEFAHNPIHKNPKVFDTDEAAKVAADIVTIVEMAKAIERRAKDYTRS